MLDITYSKRVFKNKSPFWMNCKKLICSERFWDHTIPTRSLLIWMISETNDQTKRQLTKYNSRERSLQNELPLRKFPSRRPEMKPQEVDIWLRTKQRLRRCWLFFRPVWGKTNYAICGHLLNSFYGKDVEILGLNAPGNYSASCWTNKILVLLCEEPKPNMFMISGYLTPGEPLFMTFNIPKILQRI